MPYITTGERIGYDRGKVEGQEEKAIAIAFSSSLNKAFRSVSLLKPQEFH